MKRTAAIALGGLLFFAGSAQAGSVFGNPEQDTNNVVAETIAVGLVSGIICASVASLVDPEEESAEPYARQGWLLGFEGLYATDTSEDDLQTTLRRDTGTRQNFSLKDSFGIKGQGGYRCHPRLSAEVDIEWVDEFDGTAFEDGVGKVSSTNFETLVVTTSLKGYLLTGRYQPYLLAGAGVMTAEIDQRDTLVPGSNSERGTNIAMRFGGGVDFYLTEQVVLTLGTDYLLPFGDLEDLDYVSISWGVRYRF